jgi:hypothetical protein
MMKISLVEGPTQRRLVVEGKLISPWAAELRSACEDARVDLDGRELVVEMKQVTTINQEGEKVIIELINTGVKFRCRGLFTRHVLRQLSRRASRELQEQSDD